MKRGGLISVDLGSAHLDHLSSDPALFRSKTPRKRDQDSTFYGRCHFNFIPLTFQALQHQAFSQKATQTEKSAPFTNKTKNNYKLTA
ncbi:hypothetical protein KY46_12620 [Photobacterium halotolerans]|uniref:Uncharacterized protein n=1 Tax=Photobacterium halotolerans TaxID=265726 RepID=A0A0F5VBL5_9GAMM|nr:hypothetical protein KY46_12620 [Photobacterium halotolerans]